MKKNLIILATLTLALAGCESWNNDSDESGTMREPAGSQSHSSDVNQGSSSRNVGQSGATTNGAPHDSTASPRDSQLPENNLPQQ